MPNKPCNTLQRLLHERRRAIAHSGHVPRLLCRLLLAAAGALLVPAAGLLRGASRSTPAALPGLVGSPHPAATRPGYLAYVPVGLAMSSATSTATALPRLASARGPERPSAMPSPTATPAPLVATTYVVAEGDTMAGLAERFGITPETIAWANDLSVGEQLEVGAELTILPVSGVLYQVRKGDTLQSIAQAHGVEAETIIAANMLAAPDVLSIDQALIIPGGHPAPPPTAAPVPQPAATSAPASAEAMGKGAEIVAIAQGYLGYPYVFGGSTPGTGFDCSGLTQYAYAQAGLSISRGLSGQVAAGPAVDRGALLPGDLVFFHDTYTAGLSHVGIYIGEGRFIHAASEQRGVTTDALDAAYWVAHYYGASRPWQ